MFTKENALSLVDVVNLTIRVLNSILLSERPSSVFLSSSVSAYSSIIAATTEFGTLPMRLLSSSSLAIA